MAQDPVGRASRSKIPVKKTSTVSFLVYGALGGLMPALARFMALDHHRFILEWDWSRAVGLLVYAIVGLVVGAICAFILCTEDDDKRKIFMMGMSAPSLIASFVANSSLSPPTPPSNLSLTSPRVDINHTTRFSENVGKGLLSMTLARALGVRSAYAQPSVENSEERPHIYSICRPQAPQIERFLGGITGRVPDTLQQFWSYTLISSREEAKRFWDLAWQQSVSDGSTRSGGTKPRIFAYSNESNQFSYILSIGLNLSENDARQRSSDYSRILNRQFQALRLSELLFSARISPANLSSCRFIYDPQ